MIKIRSVVAAIPLLFFCILHFISLQTLASWKNDLLNIKFENSAGLYLNNGSLTYVTTTGEQVSLNGSNFKIILPDQDKKNAAIIEHTDETNNKTKRFLLFENGIVRFIPISATIPIITSSVQTFSHKSQQYAAISVHKKDPTSTSSIILIRASDGHRITIPTEFYVNLSLLDTKFNPLQYGVELKKFEKNQGYSSYFPEYDRDLFLGSIGDKFRNITVTTPPVTSSHEQNSTKNASPTETYSITKGLSNLLKEFSSDHELSTRLKSKIFGQDHLVSMLVRHSSVVDDIYSERPKIVMITGPSGVGKSYLAEQLALEKLKDPKFYLEIDGTKYAGGDQKMATVMIHKLVGAEKAWQGSQQGELTEFLKKTGGRGIIVINEGDKMNPYVYTRLMEFFDKGILTSGEGESISGKQTLVVITSNRGARQLIPEQAKNWTESEMTKYVSEITSDQVKQVCLQKQSGNDQNTLAEEVTNRIVEYGIAGPLTKSALNMILRSAVLNENTALKKKYSGLMFNFSDAALDYLAEVNTNLFSHGRIMRQRAEHTFNTLKTSIGHALQNGNWKIDNVSSVDVSLYKDKKNKFFFLINNDLKIDVPQPINPNPMSDPKIRQIIVNLNSNIKKRVIGQDAMIDNIEQLVVNHLAQGVRYLPTVFMTIGTTGTGKTETGLAIAESIYGNKDRAGIIDMGEILSSYQFSIKFEQGLDGAESEFEKFLRNNPDGGVLILDEASNMGGQSNLTKNELFKKLYALFDRGTWTSPVTQKEYDLTKYMFQLTGNDGQHFFAGSSADEDRMAIWNKVNNEETLHEMLVEAGIPEALLARLSTIILTKPLLRSELKPIAEKLLLQKIKPIEEQYKGLKVTYASDILEILADSFFSHSKGVRAIRDTIDKRFGYAVHSALLGSGLDLDNLKGVKISLAILDNKSLKPYLDDSDSRREAKLLVTINKKNRSKPDDFIFQKNIDLTEYAQPQILDKYQEAWLTALHEAGHAVANNPNSTGEKVSFITIRGGTFGVGPNKITYKGYARTKPYDSRSNTKEIIIHQLGRIAAGNVAETLSGHPSTSGWTNDLTKMRQIGARALIDFGFDKRFLGIRLDNEGNPIMSQKKLVEFENALDSLIQEGIKYSELMLTENWNYVIDVAKELMKNGQINGDRFEEIGATLKNKSSLKSTLTSHRSLMCLGFYSH